ncbi:MAG: hypothetical protein ACI9VS_001569 [Candidatus Binatia bacterium]|jgi:hypothetical protein
MKRIAAMRILERNPEAERTVFSLMGLALRRLRMAAMVFAITLALGGSVLCAQESAEQSGDEAEPAEMSETGEDAEEAEMELTAEQQKVMDRVWELLKESLVLLVILAVASLLALIVPFRWIYLAFQNDKGWGFILLGFFVFTCISPFFVFLLLVYAFKKREESKKFFVFTLLVYMSLYGSTGYVWHRLQSLQSELESIEVEAQEAGFEREEDADGQPKAEPRSRLGKIMATAEKNVAKVEERSAEGSKVVEQTGQKAAAKSKTASKSKTPAVEPADPTKKTAPSTAKAASPPKQETAAMTSSSYARAPVNLRVVSIIAGGKRKTAMINDGVKNHMIVVGENVTLSVGGGTKGAEVVAIQANAVIIKLDGRAAPMAIHKARKK